MIRMISGWVQSILSLLLFLAFIQLLLPEGRLREYTRLVLGLVVIGAVLTPLLSLLDPHTWETGLIEALSGLERGVGVYWAPPPAHPGSADASWSSPASPAGPSSSVGTPWVSPSHPTGWNRGRLPVAGGWGRPEDPGPWIARGVTLAERAGERVHAEIHALWESQLRTLAMLVPGVEQIEVETRWGGRDGVEEVRLRVDPAAAVLATAGGADSLARRVHTVVSDYFRLPPERVRVEVEKRGMGE